MTPLRSRRLYQRVAASAGVCSINPIIYVFLYIYIGAFDLKYDVSSIFLPQEADELPVELLGRREL